MRQLVRSLVAIGLSFCISQAISADLNAVDPAKSPAPLWAPVQDKNFYLLSLLEHDQAVKALLLALPSLRDLAIERRQTVHRVFEASQSANASSMSELLLTDDQIGSVEKALRDAYGSSTAMRRVVDVDLRKSGMYYRYQSKPGAEFLASAWRDCANGINNVIGVYGLGKPARSPSIDSPSYDVKSADYATYVNTICGVLDEEADLHALFFEPSLRFALELLELSRRDEAGRFEPMEKGENRAAYRRAHAIQWEHYPYSVILVPGYGLDEPGVRLSPIQRLSLVLAAKRLRAGKAPFIVLSGGFVHPAQTPFCEAFEMKHYLVKTLHVPEDSVIIEPHARHTTTNMRNTARLIYRYGIPFDKKALLTTNIFQSGYIEGASLRDRCKQIFGYVPYEIGKRISPFDLEFRPKIESLYADPGDPLDP